MLQDLDSTLEAILNDPAAPLALQNADVSFITPDQAFVPQQNSVNLFLYELRENRRLRDPEPIHELNANQWFRRRPPVRVDCTYLVTAWSTNTGANRVAEEHQLLGQGLYWLSRFDVIPDAVLQGSLVGQPYPPPAMVAQTEAGQRLSELWGALGQAPRPAIQLVVTISIDLDVAILAGPPVVTKEIRLEQIAVPGSQEIWFAIAGTVRNNNTQAPINGATLTLVEVEKSTTTDAAGHFRFSPLAAGAYTLRTQAGVTTLDQAIQVPGAVLNAYDVALVP